MKFIDCVFDHTVPPLPGAQYEGCTFILNKEEQETMLPAPWKCQGCVVIDETGEAEQFGESSN